MIDRILQEEVVGVEEVMERGGKQILKHSAAILLQDKLKWRSEQILSWCMV